MTQEYDVAVVGAGICGLAHAWAAARRGLRVVVFERERRSQGASIRNFGMVWPVGQSAGPAHELAMSSRALWCELATAAGFWLKECGSIHLAHRDDEWDVLQEFAAQSADLGYECQLLTPEQVLRKTAAANPTGLRGGLWSPTEMCVDPRQVLQELPRYLADHCQVDLHFATPVRSVEGSCIEVSDGTTWNAHQTIIATGADFKSLFPQAFADSGLQACKLQMLRTVSQAQHRIGPHLASGLTQRHYANFTSCPSLTRLKQRVAEETPELDRYGIHVMASQNSQGEVILGDSHEYGDDITPFDHAEIDELILRELRQVLRLETWTIAERWHGIYAKHPSQNVFEENLQGNIKIVTGLGGAGMTLSLGIGARNLAD